MAQFLVPQRSAVVMRPCTLEETLPKGHLARFVWDVLESIDFNEVETLYRSIHGGAGRPPYHPRVLAVLWIYGMTQGLETAAAIAKACTNRDDFRWLAGNLRPCAQTLLNFLSATKEHVSSLWEQVLKEMHRAGHIDLSVVAEDGTKLRADASTRSFHAVEEIDAIIERLRARIAQKIQEIVNPELQKKHDAQLRALTEKLGRAEQAAQELRTRKDRKSSTDDEIESSEPPSRSDSLGSERTPVTKRFGRAEFRRDADRDVLICPADQELRFVGEYPNDTGRGSYRLYKRLDCSGCPLKAECTGARGRRVKIPVAESEETTEPNEEAKPQKTPGSTAAPAESQSNESAPKRPRGGLQASLTDPEARFMLATSEKRFEPSYNADITVTRHGVIVSEFLTTDPADFGHFRRALPNVLSTLGRPESWVGDGHYGTQANLELADREGIPLYAPVQGSEEKKNGRFRTTDFRYDPDRDVLVCPAENELHRVGTYGYDNGRPYDLFQRRDCGECSLKSQCTGGRGRRVKWYRRNHLVEALKARMKERGNELSRLRGSTVEPVNGQLKQHGLGRFHVRGLSRCSTVLTLACIAHNLMKWNSREDACAMKLAS
jgi:transposase